jgi:hypothetical protein
MIFKYFIPTRSKKDLAGQIHKLKSLLINAIITELRLLANLIKPLPVNFILRQVKPNALVVRTNKTTKVIL